MSKRIITAVIGSLLLFQFSFAQQNSITGKVITVPGKTALSNASVFIRGTSKGTISGVDGSFSLSAIPAGSYELVISSVGYHTIVHPFTSSQLPLNMTIEMTLKVTELDSVVVEPFDEETWERWGTFFLDNFIGKSDAAKDTRILNHKVIRFRYYKKSKILLAIADEPLLIENRALGYRLKYQLEDFVWNANEKSVVYLGYEWFEDMSEDRKRIPKHWIENRRTVYMGSMTHLMRALYTNRLQEEKFYVRRLVKQRNLEKDRVRDVYAMEARRSIKSGGITVMRLGSSSLNKDSNAYYRKIMSGEDYIDSLGATALTADSIVTVRSDSTRVLFFPDYLHITYTGAKEEMAFLRSIFQTNRKPRYPSSTIFLQSGSPVGIQKNGLYYPAQEVFALGYWAWKEKIAHLLPLDYEVTGE